MKLDCVLTAVNDNLLYLDFIPIFIKTWNKLYPNVDVKIVLISKNIPEDLLLYKNNIILFEPIENVLTSFTSQFIRLLYPCILDYKQGVLITDIDILPMNITYYTKNIEEIDNNKFIYYRDNVCFEYKQIAMCYNVATPKIWKDIFKINSIDDIVDFTKDTFMKNNIQEGHGNTGWCVDQIILYDKVTEWNKKTNDFICLQEKETLFMRLDRNTFDINNVNIRNNITSGKYTDYHCCRPMSEYSKLNWEIFNLLSQHSHYSNLIFTKSQLNSPVGDGLFDIFINTKENILYKKIKNTDMINIDKYKQIIYGVNSNVVLGEYICEPEKIYIENDGSYYSSYIKNGIRLYDVSKVLKLDYTILNNLKKSIKDMKEKLNNYVKTSKLSGDWALHNLIYCLDTNKIYNIDLEGFYTYPLIHDNGNCDIKYCNERFDKLLDIIDNFYKPTVIQEKINDEYFTLILWNPTLFQSKEILQDVPNIIGKKEIVVPKESLHNYIFDIYKLDTRCSHNIVLPPKIQKLKEFNNNHLIVKFKIDKPQYTEKVCNQAVQLKEMIRRKYKSNIKNYTRDIMIHIADNFEQSKYIWEKKFSYPNTLKLLVQEAKKPLRYKLTKKEKNGKDGWKTINTMNVYEYIVDGTIQFFVYRTTNPTRYCLSKEKITDNNWEYCYDFYYRESEVDERITMYKPIDSKNILNNWRSNKGDCYMNVKPIKQIFDKLTNYVVLRGYDDLHKKIPLLKNSDDIDILVTEKNDIVKLCGNNIVVINNERVKFDRRYIEDNYYDSKWQKNMIATKVKRHFFYILDESNNYYATLYHSLIHKGQITNKYEKLYKTFENKHKLNSDILSRYYQLLIFMLRNNYSFTRALDKGVGFFKNKYKLNLFIIRKKGMEKDIIENILNQIENEYQILDKLLINISNKQKFYSSFYGNYDEHKNDIEKNNDNQCLVIITNNPDDMNPNELKEKIRKQYINFYPPLGNIIHSSDSSNDCDKELELLFNENIDNFKNIGTYYSQVMI